MGDLSQATSWIAFSKKVALKGDLDPGQFDVYADYSTGTRVELLKRNVVLQAGITWKVEQMFKEGITFDVDAINRHHDRMPGDNYLWTSFDKFVEWQGVYDELMRTCGWTMLIGEVLVVTFKGQGVNGNEDVSASAIRVYYPMSHGVGYEIWNTDPITGKPTEYRVCTPFWVVNDGMRVLTTKVKEKFYDADVCVLFSAPRMDEEFTGTGMCEPLLTVARGYELFVNDMVKTTGKMGMGATGIELGDDVPADFIEEAKLIDGDNMNRLSKILLPYGSHLVYHQPQITGNIMNAQEFYCELLAFTMRVSKTHINGMAAGAIASAKENRMYTFDSIKQLRKVFHRNMVKVFYLLGNQDANFTWNKSPEEEEYERTGVDAVAEQIKKEAEPNEESVDEPIDEQQE